MVGIYRARLWGVTVSRILPDLGGGEGWGLTKGVGDELGDGACMVWYAGPARSPALRTAGPICGVWAASQPLLMKVRQQRNDPARRGASPWAGAQRLSPGV